MTLEIAATPRPRTPAINTKWGRWRSWFAPTTPSGAHHDVASTMSDVGPTRACEPAAHAARSIGATCSSGQPYRLFITSDSRAIAQRALAMLWASTGENRLTPERVSLRTEATTGLSRLSIRVVCDASQRRHLAQFVHRASELRGIRRLHWETVPPSERML
ncbi:hypothetical protein [Thiocapsa imhoffii]|nr:hypothetical protein [Thiocapsa imhoffii]